MTQSHVKARDGKVDPRDRSERKLKPQPTRAVLKRLVAPFASLKLTVTLLTFSMLLVFFGTMAQIDDGIWTVVDKYFWSVWVWVPGHLSVKFAQIFFSVPPTYQIDPAWGFPLPGGYTLGWLLFVNLIAAHMVRFKFSWKRTGIVLIHSGLILLLVGEFITRKYAVEGSMTIEEGNSSNYVIDQRSVELAIIDGSASELDLVTSIPQQLLRKGESVRNPLLPFDVTVREFYPNSSVTEPDDWNTSKANLATAGDGRRVKASPNAVVAGTEVNAKADLPSAYVSLIGKKGEELGTYLVSVWLSELSNRTEQTVSVDGKPYRFTMRFKRTYKPYTISLKDFRHDVYLGTDTPKNYQSDVRLVDSETGVDREASIKMNEPLRHRGETFYQSSFLPGDRGTVLQVVRNPGWLIPYLSCGLVSAGMLFHFCFHLFGFLRRRAVS